MNYKVLSKWMTGIGLLLIAAALVLVFMNLVRERISGDRASAVLEEIYQKRPVIVQAKENKKNQASEIPAIPEESNAVMEPEPVLPEPVFIPDYILDPEMDMPPIQIGNQVYVGVLDIPVLELSLPIQGSWDNSKLEISPCLYSGSLYLNNMILVGHNYRRHFGYLKNLSIGDEMTFTDGVGNLFTYQVAEIEVVDGNAVEDMLAGDWDMTLFTCTVSGKTRLTIRCDLVKDEAMT